MLEVEVKFLGISPDEILKRAEELGAKVKREDQHDFIVLLSPTEVIRARKSGATVSLTYKKRLKGGKYKEALEVRVFVDSFEEAVKLLQHLFPGKKYYRFTKKRFCFELDGTACEVVEVEGIPPYVEIEGDPENIEKVARLLGVVDKERSDKGLVTLLQERGIEPKVIEVRE